MWSVIAFVRYQESIWRSIREFENRGHPFTINVAQWVNDFRGFFISLSRASGHVSSYSHSYVPQET